MTSGIERLRTDLETGRWHESYRELLDTDVIDGGFGSWFATSDEHAAGA